jgi:DNA-binding response OmpR family regulator
MVQTVKPVVLIVEDDKNLNRLIAKGFALADFQVLTAHTLSDAFTHLNKHAIDFIVLDLGLPDGEGWDVVKAIEGVAVDYHPPKIIVITGRDLQRLPADQMEKYFVLQKPVEVKELIHMTFNLRYRKRL